MVYFGSISVAKHYFSQWRKPHGSRDERCRYYRDSKPEYGQRVPQYDENQDSVKYYSYGSPQGPTSEDPRSPISNIERAMSRLRFYWKDGGPVITAVIMVLCVLVWLIELCAYYLHSDFYDTLLVNGSFIPLMVKAKPWMFFTSMFMHATNITHILFNMLTLLVIGPVLEGMLGHWRYLALYMLSGIGGSVGLLISAVLRPHDWLISAVGASGAIFGLFAGVLVLYRQLGTNIRPMLVFVGINLAMPLFQGGIAWQDHIGGFVVGGLFVWLLTASLPILRGKSLNTRMWISLFGLLVLLGSIVAFCYTRVPINGFIGGY